MKLLSTPRDGRGLLVVAAFVFSGALLLNPSPAAAGNCGDGPLSTTANNLIGSAIGGAAGGLLGNQFGKGSGKGVMTGLGVVGGALAGGYVGRSMEDCGNPPPRAAAPAVAPAAAYGTAPPPSARAVHRRAAAPAPVASEARTCRFVLTQAMIGGREQPIDGIACLEPDGSWKAASGQAAERAAETDLVLRAQQRLRDEGFYVRDNIDGRWGPATSAAVGNFQRVKGLAASGQLDIPTRKALGLDSAPLAVGSSTPNGNGAQAGAAQQGWTPPVAANPGNTATAQPVQQTQ